MLCKLCVYLCILYVKRCFQEQETHQQLATLQGQLNDKAAMCRYCASKLDIHIGKTLVWDRSYGESPHAAFMFERVDSQIFYV